MWTAVLCILTAVVAPFIVLHVIGFGVAGVVAGSLAAAWQATIGNVVAGSVFAILQSFGAAGASPKTIVVLAVIGLIAWAVYWLRG